MSIVNASFRNATGINRFMKEKRKMPSFVKIKDTKSVRGYGAFAQMDIPKLARLGVYDGKVYLPQMSPTNDYLFSVHVDTSPYHFLVDGEDMRYANWTRFVNHGMTERERNTAFQQDGNKIVLYSTKHISKGDEIIASYGTKEWEDKLRAKQQMVKRK